MNHSAKVKAAIKQTHPKEAVELPRFKLADKDKAYEFFAENGCVIFSDAVNLDLLEEIKTEVGAVIHQQVDKHLDSDVSYHLSSGFDHGLVELANFDDVLRQRIYENLQHLPSAYRLMIQSHFLEIMKDVGILKPAPYIQMRMDMPSDTRYLIPPHQEISAVKSDNFRFMIVPMVDTPKECGALSVALGSHKLGPVVPEHEEAFKYQYVAPKHFIDKYPMKQAPMYAGEALVMNKLLIHSSTENVSDIVRWSVIFRCEDLENMPYLDGDDSYETFTRDPGLN